MEKSPSTIKRSSSTNDTLGVLSEAARSNQLKSSTSSDKEESRIIQIKLDDPLSMSTDKALTQSSIQISPNLCVEDIIQKLSRSSKLKLTEIQVGLWKPRKGKQDKLLKRHKVIKDVLKPGVSQCFVRVIFRKVPFWKKFPLKQLD